MLLRFQLKAGDLSKNELKKSTDENNQEENNNDDHNSTDSNSDDEENENDYDDEFDNVYDKVRKTNLYVGKNVKMNDENVAQNREQKNIQMIEKDVI